MPHKFRRLAAHLGARFFALLLVVLLAVTLAAVPAAATGDGSDSPVISFPDPPKPPTPTPTPEPTPVPTPVPTPEPTPVPTPNLTPDPTNPPYVPPQPSGNTGNNGGTTTYSTPTPTARPSQTPGPTETPQPTSQPVDDTPSAIDQPNVGVYTSPSPTSQSEDEHNYVTFARLNQKNNSLSIALFYGGLFCVVLGMGGGAALLISWLRQRSRDNREDILLKVEQAESRQRPISRQPQLWENPVDDAPMQPNQRPTSRPSGERPTGAQETLHRVLPNPQAPVPVRSTNKPLVPVAASYYTEEFSLNEEPPSAAPKTAVKAASQDNPTSEGSKPVRTASSLQAYRHQKPNPDAPPPMLRHSNGEKAQQPTPEQAASAQTASKQTAKETKTIDSARTPAARPVAKDQSGEKPADLYKNGKAGADRNAAKPSQEKPRTKKPLETDNQLPGQMSFLE